MKTKDLVWPAVGTGLLLLIPLVAMQFTSEVNWSRGDFVVMGVLLFTTGLGITFVLTTVHTTRRRLALIAVIVAVFLYIWAELAVGIFTNWGS